MNASVENTAPTPVPADWEPAFDGEARLGLRGFVLMGILAATATALQVLEAPLPRFLPWLKPGLSNALVLFGMIRFSASFGLGIVLLRTFLSGLFLGILFSPPCLLSLAGGLASVAVMGAALKLPGKPFGLGGISVLGALANNSAQLGTVGFFVAGSFPLWFHAVMMLWISLPSGIIVARITMELVRRTS